MNHTPGPWSQDGSFFWGPRGRPIARMRYEGDEEDDGNAVLIAAAPHLLDTLKLSEAALRSSITGGLSRECGSTASWRVTYNSILSKIQEAIAKAEGRTA